MCCQDIAIASQLEASAPGSISPWKHQPLEASAPGSISPWKHQPLEASDKP